MASELLLLAVIIVAIFLMVRVFCVFPSQLTGFWARSDGALFGIAAPKKSAGALVVSTASGASGAEPGKQYPLRLRDCREVRADFPAGPLVGRVDLGRRRIVWRGAGGGAPETWVKQGVVG